MCLTGSDHRPSMYVYALVYYTCRITTFLELKHTHKVAHNVSPDFGIKLVRTTE